MSLKEKNKKNKARGRREKVWMIHNAVVEKKISKKYEASLLKRLSSMKSSRCCGKF